MAEAQNGGLLIFLQWLIYPIDLEVDNLLEVGILSASCAEFSTVLSITLVTPFKDIVLPLGAFGQHGGQCVEQ